jgi:hypothetical protein
MMVCCVCFVVLLLFIEIVSIFVRNTSGSLVGIYRVSQELSSVIQELIPKLMLSRKRHIRMGPIGSGSGIMSF